MPKDEAQSEEDRPPRDEPQGARADSQEPDLDGLLSDLEDASESKTAPADSEPAPTSTAVQDGSAEEPEGEEEPSAPRGEAPSHRRLRRDRFLFYVAMLMIAGGGFGLVLGSVLHDALNVPWFGTAYEVFGPLNVEAAGLGAVIAIIGLIVLRISLRGGVMREDAARGG